MVGAKKRGIQLSFFLKYNKISAFHYVPGNDPWSCPCLSCLAGKGPKQNLRFFCRFWPRSLFLLCNSLLCDPCFVLNHLLCPGLWQRRHHSKENSLFVSTG